MLSERQIINEIDGNTPGENFLGDNFPEGSFPRGSLMRWNFLGRNPPGEIFLEPLSS